MAKSALKFYKKKLIFIETFLAIVAVVGFSSVLLFDFDFDIDRKNNSIVDLDDRADTIEWNLMQADSRHESAMNLRTQIDILSMLKADVTPSNEELIEILRSSIRNVLHVNNWDKKKDIYNKQVIERPLSIFSYKQYRSLFVEETKKATKLHKEIQSQRRGILSQIEDEKFLRTTVLIVSIFLNIIVLMINGLVSWREN